MYVPHLRVCSKVSFTTGTLSTIGIFSSLSTHTTKSQSYISVRYEAQVFTQHPRPRATVVNISSLAAQQPFPSWGIYCAGKAARDMYHSVLAAEQSLKWENVESTKDSGSGEIRVLNYAPGPLDTKMQEDIREAELRDSKLGTVYTNMKEQNLLVDPLESAEKLLHLLRHPHSFRSGDHVDFYDELTLISGVHSGLKNC